MKTIRTLAALAMAASLSLFGGGVSALGRQISTCTDDVLALGREIAALAEEVISRTSVRIPAYTPYPCVESTAALDNPYIGWYQIHAYTLSDTPCDLTDVLEQDYGPGLVLLQFNLRGYADGPVSDAGLEQLERILDAWHSRGRQLILRFLYDWDGKPLGTEPGNLSQILEHMSQTAEVVNRHRDCVYILQGIYAGSWGEMHGSEYTDAEDMLTLLGHLASVTDPSIYLAVRTPAQWRAVKDAQEGDPADAALLRRLGLYNDGLLGSETDLGTYGQGDSDFSAGQTQKRSRQDEITFQNTLCNHVPNGGEVIIDNPYNDFPSAVQDLAAIHVSYLNDRYDEAVLAKWQADSFTGDGPFRGMSGYDYIAAHLGYRYVLRSSALSAPASPEEAAVLSLALENVGFSPCYRTFDVALGLESASGSEAYVLPVETDTRLWIPGQEILLEIPLDVSSLALGEYALSLTVSDPLSGSEVRLANEGALEGRGCPVGSLTIRKSSQ